VSFFQKRKKDHIYFVEAQFKRERDFYPRLFGEIFLYLRQYRPANNWRAVVLFPKEAVDPGVHDHYQEFFESGRLQRLYLSRLSKEYLEKFPLSLFQIILDSEQEVLSTVQKFVRQLPKNVSKAEEQETIVQLLSNLLMEKLPKLSFLEMKKMVEPLFSNIKKSRAYQEIAREVTQEQARKIAKSLLRKKMSIALIAEVTGLSKEEVRALGNKRLAARKH
jgi:predicted transposase/invertase (TIGR01784 family)